MSDYDLQKYNHVQLPDEAQNRLRLGPSIHLERAVEIGLMFMPSATAVMSFQKKTTTIHTTSRTVSILSVGPVLDSLTKTLRKVTTKMINSILIAVTSSNIVLRKQFSNKLRKSESGGLFK